MAICAILFIVSSLLRKPVRKHLNALLEQTSRQGAFMDTPWQSAVWLHQNEAGVPLFSTRFFLTTWTVYTGWRIYHGTRTVLWLPGPDDSVEVARRLRSIGWKDVFICSIRFGLPGPSHRVVGNLDDRMEFTRLALELEREQRERFVASLAANAFGNLVHRVFGPPAGIVRGVIQVIRFGRSRQNLSLHEFWAILAWRFAGKRSEKEKGAAPDCMQPSDQYLGFWEQHPAEAYYRAHYSYEVHGKVIAIVGANDASISVTNDAENVIDELAEKGLDLSQYRVIYRDECGAWDEILVKDGRFAGFHILKEYELTAALAKLELVTE
jgi:hypothetical protein